MEAIERITGGLFGVAVGDALGATLEFGQPRPRGHEHTEITGGGAFNWAPGAPTDDTDLTLALAEVYAEGYTLQRAADRFLAWYQSGPRDVGGTTASALDHYRAHRDPTTSGRSHERSAANGSLMRTIPVALARSDALTRREEAAAVSAITHAEPRCVDACRAYCDLVDWLLRDATPSEALTEVVADRRLHPSVRNAMQRAPLLPLAQHDTTGYVLGTLGLAVWALMQPLSFEEGLLAVVNRGGDADTTGAVAGGLIGVRDGIGAIPDRWLNVVEVRSRAYELSAALAIVRGQAPTL